MDKFDKVLFFEKEYESEFVERDRINSNATNTITLLTINLTIFYYFIINIPNLFFPENISFSYILIYISIWFYSIYFINILMKFKHFYFYNYQYMKFPYANSVMEYFNQLNNNEKDINQYLLNFYVDATTHNSKVNEYKSSLQFDIRKLLFIQFFVLFFTFIPYYFIMDGKLNIYTVEIKKGE